MNNKTGIQLADKHLVDAVLGGNSGAFETIIKNTEGLVAQIVFKMIADAEDRKDIAQDIYLKAFKHLSSFRFNAKLSTWIGQIAYNTCFSYLEKKKLVLLHPADETAEGDEEALDRMASQPIYIISNETERLLFRKELSELLAAEIERLPAVYKTLLTLYHHEELSYEEIGQVTGLPEGTVKNYLFRSRRILKNRLLSKYKKEEL